MEMYIDPTYDKANPRQNRCAEAVDIDGISAVDIVSPWGRFLMISGEVEVRY